MVLVLGEVQTAVLRHSEAVPPRLAERVLDLMAGERVRISEHPNAYAVSPEIFTGVDCPLVATSGARVRGAGTLAGRALIIGGRVAQSSVAVRIVSKLGGRRLPWSYYLSRLGVVETMGKADLVGIGAAHLGAAPSAPTVLGMGALCDRLLAKAQESHMLDWKAPFTAQRTALRWMALSAPEPAREPVRFTIEADGLRTLRLPYSADDLPDMVELCEDLALHNWLLTALLTMIERSRIGVDDPADAVARLRPAVDHLLHLWMPGARLGEAALAVWGGLERQAGLSRQWDTSVRRIRDQLAMSAVLLHLREAHPAHLRDAHHAHMRVNSRS